MSKPTCLACRRRPPSGEARRRTRWLTGSYCVECLVGIDFAFWALYRVHERAVGMCGCFRCQHIRGCPSIHGCQCIRGWP